MKGKVALCCNAAIVAIAVCLCPKFARSETDHATEIGNWSCSISYNLTHPGAPKFPVTCQSDKPYSLEFGDYPHAVFTACVHRSAGPDPSKGPTICLEPKYFKVHPNTERFVIDITDQYYGLNLGERPDVYTDTFFGVWMAVGSPVAVIDGHTRYVVTGVVYSPPGNPSNQASVTYQKGDSSGFSLSASKTFAVTNKLTSTTGLSFGDKKEGGSSADASASSSFSVSAKNSDSEQFDFKSTMTTGFNVSGPTGDGIDHSLDKVYIMLMPKVRLAVGKTFVKWTAIPGDYHTFGFTIKQLMHPDTIDASALAELTEAKLGPNDFKTICLQDVLADCGSGRPDLETAFNSQRFQFYAGVEYRPNSDKHTGNFTVDSNNISQSSVETSYGVGFSTEVKIVSGIFTNSSKDETTWQWTNSSTRTKSQGDSYGAAFVIAPPSSQYSGDAWCDVFFDKIYKTYAFRLVPPSHTAVLREGELVDALGKPATNSQLKLKYGESIFVTWSDSNGRFEFRVPTELRQLAAPDKVKVIPEPGVRVLGH